MKVGGTIIIRTEHRDAFPLTIALQLTLTGTRFGHLRIFPRRRFRRRLRRGGGEQFNYVNPVAHFPAPTTLSTE